MVFLAVKPIPWMAAGLALGALSATRLQDMLSILLVLPYLKTMNKKAFLQGYLSLLLRKLSFGIYFTDHWSIPIF